MAIDYTGEQDLSEIGRTIAEELTKSGRTFERCERDIALSYRHCRIVIYAKCHTPLPQALKDRSVSEKGMPDALIGDFASMVKGLLPNTALTSLAAIRENTHQVLDRFTAKLDPAFLTHRACLASPDDAQQHMVDQLASELHAIMADATVTGDPAGMKAISEWLRFSFGQTVEIDFGEEKKASFEETVALLSEGYEKRIPPSLSKTKGFRSLTAGFSKDGNAEHQLDSQLAWMMNFRTVTSAAAPILQLGTVVRKTDTTNELYYLCMRPRCDSIRLQDKTTFLFLPLLHNLKKENMVQLVLRIDMNTYKRVCVCTEATQWLIAKFVPASGKGSVIAGREDKDFYFTDEDKTRFDWLGELKAEFAQRVAHRFALGLSRVATNNSEWLRREENLSD